MLDMNRIRQIGRYGAEEKPLPHEVFIEHKKQELAETFHFENLSEFIVFFSDFISISSFEETQNWSSISPLDLILHNHFQQQPVSGRGFEFIQHILEKGNPTGYVPYQQLFQDVTRLGAGIAKQFCERLQSQEFENKQRWLESFYRLLPPELVNETYCCQMLAFYEAAELPMIWFVKHLENYRRFHPQIFREVLERAVERNDAGGRALLWSDFFTDNIHQFSAEDLPLLQKAYFQQDALQDHFDHDFKNWLAILKINNDFLSEYVRHKSWDDPFKSPQDHKYLGTIWGLPNAEEIVENALLAVDWISSPGIYPHSYVANELFQGIPSEEHERAKVFLEKFLETNATHEARTQVVFNMIRNNFGDDIYEKCFLRFLSMNPNLEFFKEIRWGADAKTQAYFGEVNFGEMEAARWEKVLAMLDKVPDQFIVAKHRAFVKSQIEAALADAERERNWRHPLGY